MTELKPCPFCGEGNASVARDGGTYWVRCGYAFCRATGPPKSTPSLAKLAWDQVHRHAVVPTALPVTKTLHDEYTMAALTGLLAKIEWNRPEAIVADARDVADAAMKARGA